jgi:3-oxoacyl-[acyl-carrier protein] reductase
MRQAIVSEIPMGRAAVPEDVANGVLFLSSDRAEFLTGVILDIDGGRSI